MFAFMFMPLLALGVPSDSGLEPNEEIVVVAHADYEVYVAPIVGHLFCTTRSAHNKKYGKYCRA